MTFPALPVFEMPGALLTEKNYGISLQAFTPLPVIQAADSLPAKSAKNVLLRNLSIPLALVAVGLAGKGRVPLIPYNAEIQEEIQEHYSGFNTKLDDYTRHVPIVSVYALNLAGIKGSHDLYNLTALYLLSKVISYPATSNLKKLTHELRPDRSTSDAFPSGHTSEAFMEATIFYLEYKDRSIWYGVGGYGVAAATGGLRMLNNKHWFSDVLAGAGVGILSTRVAYAIYPWIQQKISQGIPRVSGHQLMILPSYAFQTPGISLLYTIK